MKSAPPDDADLQRLDALNRDLQAAIDRAIAGGAGPADVFSCLAYAFGYHMAQISPPPDTAKLFLMFRRIAASGRETGLAERAIARASKVYGGEARLRRASR